MPGGNCSIMAITKNLLHLSVHIVICCTHPAVTVLKDEIGTQVQGSVGMTKAAGSLRLKI